LSIVGDHCDRDGHPPHRRAMPAAGSVAQGLQPGPGRVRTTTSSLPEVTPHRPTPALRPVPMAGTGSSRAPGRPRPGPPATNRHPWQAARPWRNGTFGRRGSHGLGSCSTKAGVPAPSSEERTHGHLPTQRSRR
jgi:hypothetical protein